MNSSKVVIVTGASQGIGAAIVKAFRKLDYRIVATSRSIDHSRLARRRRLEGSTGSDPDKDRPLRAGKRANQPDFLTPYLSAVLGSIGLKSLQFFPVQATAFLAGEAAVAAREKALAVIDLSVVAKVPCLVAVEGA